MICPSALLLATDGRKGSSDSSIAAGQDQELNHSQQYHHHRYPGIHLAGLEGSARIIIRFAIHEGEKIAGVKL
jgi:hypothetical protein